MKSPYDIYDVPCRCRHELTPTQKPLPLVPFCIDCRNFRQPLPFFVIFLPFSNACAGFSQSVYMFANIAHACLRVALRSNTTLLQSIQPRNGTRQLQHTPSARFLAVSRFGLTACQTLCRKSVYCMSCCAALLDIHGSRRLTSGCTVVHAFMSQLVLKQGGANWSKDWQSGEF